jgi:hypothetical protein
MLCHKVSGPEIGLPASIAAGFYGKTSTSDFQPAEGLPESRFGSLPNEVRSKSGPETRFLPREQHCVTYSTLSKSATSRLGPIFGDAPLQTPCLGDIGRDACNDTVAKPRIGPEIGTALGRQAIQTIAGPKLLQSHQI